MNTDNNKNIRNLTISSPVIIIGFARSGTNLLSKLLRKYLNIHFFDNTIIKKYYNGEINRFENLNDDVDVAFAVDKIYKKACIDLVGKHQNIELNVRRILKDIAEKDTGGILNAIFNQITKQMNMTGWGFKTPDQIHTWPVLYNLFPRAKYIHIIRDWRNASISVDQPAYWGNNGIKDAMDWKKQIEIAGMFEITLPKNQFIEVRYEDLVRTPECVLKRLMAFLKIRDHENKLKDRISNQLGMICPKTAGKAEAN